MWLAIYQIMPQKSVFRDNNVSDDVIDWLSVVSLIALPITEMANVHEKWQ